MIPFELYQVKNEIVEAVLLTNENIDKIFNSFDGMADYSKVNDEIIGLIIPNNEGFILVELGNYLVQYFMGNYTSYKPGVFNSMFEKICM